MGHLERSSYSVTQRRRTATINMVCSLRLAGKGFGDKGAVEAKQEKTMLF